jgi:hypothetical protein
MHLVSKQKAAGCVLERRQSAVRTEDWRAPCRWSGSLARARTPPAAAARASGRCGAARRTRLQHPRCTLCSGVVFHERVPETQQQPPRCRSAPPPASPPSQVSAAASAAPARTHPAPPSLSITFSRSLARSPARTHPQCAPPAACESRVGRTRCC